MRLSSHNNFLSLSTISYESKTIRSIQAENKTFFHIVIEYIAIIGLKAKNKKTINNKKHIISANLKYSKYGFSNKFILRPVTKDIDNNTEKTAEPIRAFLAVIFCEFDINIQILSIDTKYNLQIMIIKH